MDPEREAEPFGTSEIEPDGRQRRVDHRARRASPELRPRTLVQPRLASGRFGELEWQSQDESEGPIHGADTAVPGDLYHCHSARDHRASSAIRERENPDGVRSRLRDPAPRI